MRMTKKKLRRYIKVLDALSKRYLDQAKDTKVQSLRDYYEGLSSGYHRARDIILHGERELIDVEDC
jgi:hypothetical protein